MFKWLGLGMCFLFHILPYFQGKLLQVCIDTGKTESFGVEKAAILKKDKAEFDHVNLNCVLSRSLSHTYKHMGYVHKRNVFRCNSPDPTKRHNLAASSWISGTWWLTFMLKRTDFVMTVKVGENYFANFRVFPKVSSILCFYSTFTLWL